MMKRSKQIEKRRQEAVEEKAGLLKNIEEYDDLKLSPLPYHADRILSLREVSVAYGGRTICGRSLLR